jgi:hypothetical protein
MNAPEFVERLATFRSEFVFNPYSERCSLYDAQNAPEIRKQNLIGFLEAVVARNVETIWFGRDFGYRGGRRTGLALTDEVHLEDFSRSFNLPNIKRATIGPVFKERTASEVWKLIRRISEPPLLWNAFPFHPFEPNSPMTNRCHSGSEFQATENLLSALLDWIRPKQILALGRDAEAAVKRFGYKCIHVRHPSYGGQTEFASAISSIYGLKPQAAGSQLLL